jgi:hypothetical protein
MLVSGRSLVRISADKQVFLTAVFSWFISIISGKFRNCTSIRLRSLPSKSFPIHYFLVFPPCNARQSKHWQHRKRTPHRRIELSWKTLIEPVSVSSVTLLWRVLCRYNLPPVDMCHVFHPVCTNIYHARAHLRVIDAITFLISLIRINEVIPVLNWAPPLWIYLPMYGSIALVNLGRFFSSLIYTQSAGLLGRGISLSQGRYLHTEHHKHRINVHRHPCLQWDSNPRPHCSSGWRRFMA